MIGKLIRLAIVAGLALWIWRFLAGRGEPEERAGVSYADGAALVLEPGLPGFDRLAAIARSALTTSAANRPVQPS